jgi:hypothetical protein
VNATGRRHRSAAMRRFGGRSPPGSGLSYRDDQNPRHFSTLFPVRVSGAPLAGEAQMGEGNLRFLSPSDTSKTPVNFSTFKLATIGVTGFNPPARSRSSWSKSACPQASSWWEPRSAGERPVDRVRRIPLALAAPAGFRVSRCPHSRSWSRSDPRPPKRPTRTSRSF